MRTRVLFVASPMVGHVLPLVPLAAAFRDPGHDVVVATGADGVDAARRAGLPVGDVAPAVHVGKVIGGVLLRHPVHVLRMVGGDNGTDGVGRIFAAITARMADPTLALADEMQPDLVLHEALAPVGALAAGRRGVSSVLVDAIIFDGRRLFTAVTSHLDRLAHRSGVAAVPEPADTVTAIPASLVGGAARSAEALPRGSPATTGPRRHRSERGRRRARPPLHRRAAWARVWYRRPRRRAPSHASCWISRAGASASDGPYQVRCRPLTKTGRACGHASGPSSGVKA